MMGHNICFKGVIWKSIPKLSFLSGALDIWPIYTKEFLLPLCILNNIMIRHHVCSMNFCLLPVPLKHKLTKAL